MAGVIIGNFPPAGWMPEQGIAAVADSVVRAPLGAIFSVKDTNDNWSLVAYYQAGATILQGDALQHDTSQYKTYRMVQASIGLTTASGGIVGLIPRGFAAANVSNTGYYSYRYIMGYCPTIKFKSTVASNAICGIGSVTAGAVTSSVPYNGTLGDVIHNTLRLGVVYSLDVNAATAVNSGIIQAFML